MLLHKQTSRIVCSAYIQKLHENTSVTKLCPYLFFIQLYITAFGIGTIGQYDLERRERGEIQP
jgi:hypothetical protein